MGNVFRKIRYIFDRNQKIKFIILFFIVLGGALAETVGVSIIVPFISVVAYPETVIEQPIMLYFYNFFRLKSVNEFLILMALFLVFVYIAKNAYLLVMYKLQFRFVCNNQMRLSSKLMSCYMKKPYEYHLNKNSSEIVRSVTNDIPRLFELVSNALLLMTECMVVVCVGALLIVMEPFMTLATLVMLSVAMIVFIAMYKKILNKAGIISQLNQGLMIKWINQGLGGIKEIKAMNREQFFIDEYSKAASKFAMSQRKRNTIVHIPKLFIEALCICGMLLVIIVMLYTGRDISTMLPQLAAFAVAAFRIMPSFNRITMYYNNVVFYIPSVDAVYRDLKDNEDNYQADAECNEDIDLDLDSKISISHVTYRYPNMGTDVIYDACFEIPIRKSVAIIGSSGAGKTTFADILLGLLKPNAGSITVRGVDVHENLKNWSKKIGYIPQSIFICDDTIKSNVAFGIRDEEIVEDDVWSALEKAQLKGFVEKLPESINTVVGERGIRLSGGQRQRIGIARAFYNNPEILLLDEATSSLDNDTEAAVMEAVDSVKNEKTLIIIAHRMSTIKNCDMVINIENINGI